jgi:hypothetical protein
LALQCFKAKETPQLRVGPGLRPSFPAPAHPHNSHARRIDRSATITEMRLALWIGITALVFVAFNSDKVRKYFGVTEPEAPPVAERKVEKPSDTSTGAAPSPGNDPNMHNSPTRRLGF